ncbi:MAG TPA: hypothetical protein VEH07_09260 [Alphaproteobacteria bacterium]|nr:hypothetical protein [Alphaproteobacteria bacterium]
MAIGQVKVDPSLGEIVLRLQAERAQPIQGVISSHDSGEIIANDRGDGSIVEWILPAAPGLYVVYGVITPLSNLWFAPGYSRSLLQGSSLCRGIENPRRFSTSKHGSEWVGPPEVFKVVLQGK